MIRKFDLQYADFLSAIMDSAPETNRRTGKKVKAIHGACFELLQGELPLLSLRDINLLWTCAEVVWFMAGSCDAAWMERFGFKTWNKFADQHGVVHSATGFRWRQSFGVDQLDELVHKLEEDTSNRQGVLLSWDPRLDMVNPGPNAPCVMIWHFHVLDGTLCASALQRSGDMYYGVPHDVLGTRLVQMLIAARLGADVGPLSYLVSNAHLYEDQWPAAEEMMLRAENQEESWTPIGETDEALLTRRHFERAVEGDQSLPQELYKILKAHYDPLPPIAGPKLVI